MLQKIGRKIISNCRYRDDDVTNYAIFEKKYAKNG